MVYLPRVVIFRRGEDTDVYDTADTIESVIAKLPAAEKIALGILSQTDLDALNDHEDNQIADYVDFEDHSCGATGYTHDMGRNVSKNGAPFQETARNVDTGFSGSRYSISLNFDEKAGPHPALEKLRLWSKSKNTDNNFKQGKIGIYNWWSIPVGTTTDIAANTLQKLPTKSTGYIIQSVQTQKNLDIPTKSHATIILEESILVS